MTGKKIRIEKAVRIIFDYMVDKGILDFDDIEVEINLKQYIKLIKLKQSPQDLRKRFSQQVGESQNNV